MNEYGGFIIDSFRGEYFFLSNFYEAPVTYDGITYQNNEAAFQARKICDHEIQKSFSVMSPSEAKHMGRQVKLRNDVDWELVKTKFMYEIVKEKFLQNEDLKVKLLSTNNEELIEGIIGEIEYGEK